MNRLRQSEARKVLEQQVQDLLSRDRIKDSYKKVKTKKPELTGKDVWSETKKAKFMGKYIANLPKAREFWEGVEFHELSLHQLKAIVDLLCLDVEGRKMDIARCLQDWVDMPSIMARSNEIAQQQKKAEQLEASGSVFAFGNNLNGQLGIGNRESKLEPTEIEALKGCQVVQIFSGFDADYAFAMTARGEIYSWGGGGTSAPLGNAQFKKPSFKSKPEMDEKTSKSTFLYPQMVKRLRLEDVVTLACARSRGHVAAVTGGGQCFIWGQNDYGQLGTGGLENIEEPEEVATLKDFLIVEVDVGYSHTAAITDDGKLYTWGSCWAGQLGLGQNKREGIDDAKMQLCFPTPTIVQSLATKIIRQVSCGAVHTAVVCKDGFLYTFGCGDGGRLGLGNNRDVSEPIRVQSLEDDRVLQVSCSNWHTLCIAAPRKTYSCDDSKSGWVYVFGNGLNGQLGLGKQKVAVLPTRIPTFVSLKVKCTAVSSGLYHNCALSNDGKIYTWGRNISGSLGRPTDGLDSFEPGIVEKVKTWGQGPVVSTACGSNFTLVLTSPWKGISKRNYANAELLNSREKEPEKITSRLVKTKLQQASLLKPVETNNTLSNKELENLMRPKKCGINKACPGFKLDVRGISGTYICENCKLPKRLHQS